MLNQPLQREDNALHSPEPSPEEKLEQLERLLQSRSLQSAESLKAFLRFVVTKSIESPEIPLKEYTIATEVFGRSDHHDSRTDSLVRVQAGRLRAKLQEYYSTEGKGDRILIELPKGQYFPLFSYLAQNSEVSVAAEPKLHAAAPATQPVTASAPRPSKLPVIIIACLASLCAVLAIALAKYYGEASRLKSAPANAAADSGDMRLLAPLWKDFLRSPDPIVVAYSNTVFQGVPETGMKLLRSLDAPGQPPMPQSAGAGEQKPPIITDHYTGVGEVMSVFYLGDLFSKASRQFRVKRSLLLTWDELKTQNIVILGSPAENLLLREMPQEQDFVFRLVGKYGIVNLRPQPGEQKIFLPKHDDQSPGQVVEDYATISLLRGVTPNHKFLILAGISTFGTQAAAEYLTKPEYVSELLGHLNTSADPQQITLPEYYQVVIKVKVNSGVPVQISYVTHHVLE